MPSDSVKYLIIGGGIAGAGCLKELRERDPDSSVMLVTREPEYPYHRPPLTKEYLRQEQSKDEVYFEKRAWYKENGVEVHTDSKVVALDPHNRTAELAGGGSVSFEKALLAMGSRVRVLPVPGADLAGIYYMRTLENCEVLKAAATGGKEIVLIGGSFIATELAASLTALGNRCRLVMQEEEPLERFFGAEVGRYFGDILRANEVELHPSQHLMAFEGENGKVDRVITKDGDQVKADIVVVGAGVLPNIELAKQAGLKTDRGVLTDKFLQSSVEGIFAAGDIAEYDSLIHDQRMRVEHWDVAINQGIYAARNMLGGQEAYDVVPYFWSDLADWSSMETVGPAIEWDKIWWRGSIKEKEFTAWYVHNDRLVGALSVNRSDDIEVARELMTKKVNVRERRSDLENKAGSRI
jgi:3-phenylpropionate/trans-cinnamate dioxygenase ferredoxin reductase subunit